MTMDFVERDPTETLVQHLARNAAALNLTDLQRADLVQAYRLQHGTRADQRRSRQIANAIQAQLDGAVVDAVTAAEAKGEGVEPFNSEGAIRIRSRDGLSALYLSGAIGEQCFRIGVAYRLFFEAVGSAGLRSQLADPDRVRKSGLNAAPAAALFTAYVGVRLTLAESTIQKADVTGRMLHVVRGVAGQGNPITSMGKGNARAANIKALKAGLAAAQPVLWSGDMLSKLQIRRFAA